MGMCRVDILKWTLTTALLVCGSYLTSAQPQNVTQLVRELPPFAASSPASAAEPGMASAPGLAPAIAPAPVLAPAPALAPSIAPALAPAISPALAPTISPAPVLAPAIAPAPALAPSISPAPSPIPAPAPELATDRYAGLLDFPSANVYSPSSQNFTSPLQNYPHLTQSYQPQQFTPPQPQSYQPQGFNPQGYQPQSYQPQNSGYEVEQPEVYSPTSKFGNRPTQQFSQPQGQRYEYEAAEVEATTPQPYLQAYQPQYMPPPASPPIRPAYMTQASINQIPKIPEIPNQQPQTWTNNPAPNAKLPAKVHPQYADLLRGHLVMAQQRKLLADNLRRFLTPPSYMPSGPPSYQHQAPPRLAPSSYRYQSSNSYSGAVKEVYEMMSTGEMKCKNLYRLHNLDYMRHASSVCGQRLRCLAPYSREVQMGNFCMCCPYLDPGTMAVLQTRPQM